MSSTGRWIVSAARALVGYLMLGREQRLLPLGFHLEFPGTSERARLLPLRSRALGPAGIVAEGVPTLIERGLETLSSLLGRELEEPASAAFLGTTGDEGSVP
jgi:hypothetical protein